MTITSTMTAPGPAPIVTAAETTPRRPDQTSGGKGPLVVSSLLLATGLLVAMLAHRWVPAVGVLTWAVGLGVVAGNVGLVPGTSQRTLGRITKRLLRAGIVLLGFSTSLAAVAGLGVPVVVLVASVLVSTLVVTAWLGRRLGMGGPRSLVLATGFAICGASAIAAMEETAGADDEDVTAAIAMVTLWGSIALVALPLLAGPLGLSDLQAGVWVGASVHEVGQVVAAGNAVGGAAVAIAVVVKLTRVLLLAPVVASVSLGRRRRGGVPDDAVRRPPVVPLFVLGFLACALWRTTGTVPDVALDWIAQVQVAALAVALFGMGATVRIGSLLRKSGSTLLVGGLSTLFITGASLLGVLLVVHS